MSEQIKYTCSNCDKEHEQWPALTYLSPTNYATLSEEDKQNIAELTSDFFIITHPDQKDCFIPLMLVQACKA
jgi:hypothetical protein